jgi:hypothetical protein
MKILFDSVEGALSNFRRKFDSNQRIFKLSAIFQIWLGKNHQYGVRGLNVLGSAKVMKYYFVKYNKIIAGDWKKLKSSSAQ